MFYTLLCCFDCCTQCQQELKKFFLLLSNKMTRAAKPLELSTLFRNRHPEVFLVKVVLKICNKFKREHPCRSLISIKPLGNFNYITLQHGCSHVNMLHIFRTPFPKKTSDRLLLYILLKWVLAKPRRRNALSFKQWKIKDLSTKYTILLCYIKFNFSRLTIFTFLTLL